MSNYSVTYTDSDLQETLLSIDELILRYEELYKNKQIYWNPKTIKTRAWSFFLYPDSASENWLDILHSFKCPFCISPLHDKDIKPDGTPKKPHYHIIYISEGPCYFKTCLVFMHQLGGVFLEPVHSLRGAVRYHIHMDDPQKYPYNRDDIICTAGFDPSEFFEISEIEITNTSKAMSEYILSHGIDEYNDFVSVCLGRNGFWYKILTERQGRHFENLIHSLRYSGTTSFVSFLCFIKPLVSPEFYMEIEDLYSVFRSSLHEEAEKKIHNSKKEEPEE